MATENEESQVNFQKLIVIRSLTVLVLTWENVQKQCSVKIRVLNSSLSARNFQHEVLVSCYRQKIGKANSGRTVIKFISTKRENALLHTAFIEYH